MVESASALRLSASVSVSVSVQLQVHCLTIWNICRTYEFACLCEAIYSPFPSRNCETYAINKNVVSADENSFKYKAFSWHILGILFGARLFHMTIEGFDAS